MSKKELFVGFGGAGKNVLKMASSDKLNGKDILFIGTDKKSLDQEKNHSTLLIGEKALKGRGASRIVLFGKKAIDESLYEMECYFNHYEQIIIVCGVLGGTGGAICHLVEKLLELGCSIGVFLIYPFDFETGGKNRINDIFLQAEKIKSELVFFHTLKPFSSNECSPSTSLTDYIDRVNKHMLDTIIYRSKAQLGKV